MVRLSLSAVGISAIREVKTIQILNLLTPLNKFRKSEGWEAGVDAEVTLIKAGPTSLSRPSGVSIPSPVVFDQTGLMAGVSIKGAKFTPIHPEKAIGAKTLCTREVLCHKHPYILKSRCG
jgi:lipid-binding SYLF domain-containing protein